VRLLLIYAVCHCEFEILAHAYWLTNLESTVYILYWNSAHSMWLNNMSQNTSVSDHSTTSVEGQRKIAWLLVEMFLVTVVQE